MIEHAIRIFNDTLVSITGAESNESAEDTAQLLRGYLVGIRLLGIVNSVQYGAMSDLLNVALESAQKHIKKTASLLEQESGSKEGHPKTDASNTFSLDETVGNVKRMNSTYPELSVGIYELIRSMRRAKIDDHSIVETLVAALAPPMGGNPNAE